MESVVITGIGLITSIGNDTQTVTKSLKEQRHGIEAHPELTYNNAGVTLAGTIKGFDVSSTDPEDWAHPGTYSFKRETLRSLAPHGLYSLYSTEQAIADAGLTKEEISDPQTGMFTASAGSPKLLNYHLNKAEDQGMGRGFPLAVVCSISGTLSFNLVAAYKILGSSSGFVSACASSGHALGFAHDEIAMGRQNRMIVVGAEDCNRQSILPFACMRALSTQTDPKRASCPFDKDRNGFISTGGATTLILENEAVARKRGAKVYAKIDGWGQASDGHNVAISHPEGTGLARAMNNALKASGKHVQDIDYVNAHATSTAIGDAAEICALKKVFEANSPAISSTKALTGHGLSLASIMETAFCTLSIDGNFTPGSAHIQALDPKADSLNIIQKTLDTAPNTILTNSSGFGGANVSIVLSKIN